MFLKRSLTPLVLASLVLGPACHCGSSAIRSQAPQIDVQPPAIVITPVPLKHSSTVQIQVKNAGNTDLHLTKDPQLSESDADGNVEYDLASALTKDCQGNTRPPDSHLTLVTGECALVTLRYTPANVDADPGQLTFFSDDPDHGTLRVPISLGSPAVLKLCTLKADGSVDACDATDGTPPTLDFGLTAKNTIAKRKLRLQNEGQVRIDFSAIQPPDGTNKADFAREAAGLPAFLDPGKTFDLAVSFAPTTSGQRAAFLEIDSNDSTRDPIKVPLAGHGDGPAICATPSPVEFGQAGVGQKVDKTLTLTNCGTVDVNLQALSFDAFSSPTFDRVGSLPGAQKLAPGAAITVGLRWTPDETGDALGTLNIFNDGNPNQTVDLHGTAIATCLSASVRTLDFGQVAKGQSTDRPLTVANNSTHACTLNHVVISAGSSYFTVSNAPSAPIVLRPGDAYSVSIKYSVPASDNNSVDNGTVTFQSNDTVNPNLDVALVGHPVAAPACKLQIVPSVGGIPPFGGRTLVFGSVTVSKDKTLPVTFKNIGSGPCTISGYKFVTQFGIPIPGGPGGNCSNTVCDDFHLVGPAPSGTLQPGQTTSINITFTPTSTNAPTQLGPTDFLQVQTSDQNIAANAECIWGIPPNSNAGCVQVGMSGQGDISNLQVLPSDLDFGLTTLGCKTQKEYVTLYNTGTTATIHIKSIKLNPATAPFYLVSPPTPFAMAPGSQVKLEVTYRPTGALKETAQLLIENDASNTTTANPYVTVGLTGTGTTDKHQTDTFTQSLLPKVDLLFVIDNSGSFEQYQSQLSGQAKAFICAAKKDPSTCDTSAWKADFHIGVTSNEPDQTDTADSASAYRGDKIYVGGLFGHPNIIDNNTPGAITAFSKNVKIGTCCSDARESGAESAWRSLTPKTNQTPPPQGSQGFVRDDARLVLLSVTDEVDQSHNNTAFYVDFFQQLKGRYNAGLVSFNAITGDKTNGCSANGIQAAANDFDVEIVSKTGGQFWSLCTADWAKIAGDLTLDAFNGRKQFALSRVADPATVVVKLNGVLVAAPADYTFDQASNSVVFKLAPAPGAVIVVDYDAICF